MGKVIVEEGFTMSKRTMFVALAMVMLLAAVVVFGQEAVYDIAGRDISGGKMLEQPIGLDQPALLKTGWGKEIGFQPYKVTPLPEEAKCVATLGGLFPRDQLVAATNKNIYVSDLRDGTTRSYPLTNNWGGAQALVTGDLNGDWRPDVAVAFKNSVFVFEASKKEGVNEAREFPSGNTADALAIYLGQKNKPMLAVGHWNEDYLNVFGYSSGSLQVIQKVSLERGGYDALAVGHLTGHNRDDLLHMRGQGLLPKLSLVEQKKDGRFLAPIEYGFDGIKFGGLDSRFITPSDVAVGDLNRDGLDDFVVAINGNIPYASILVWLQKRGGGFDGPVLYPAYHCPEAIALADFDRDGDLDIAVAHGGWMAMSVFKNQGKGIFGSNYLKFPLPYTSHYLPDGLTVGCFNGDIFPDVAIADYNNGVVTLMNGYSILGLNKVAGEISYGDFKLISQFSSSQSDSIQWKTYYEVETLYFFVDVSFDRGASWLQAIRLDGRGNYPATTQYGCRCWVDKSQHDSVWYRLRWVFYNGVEQVASNYLISKGSLPTDVEVAADATQPTEFALQQNYPNPFNPTTTIEFQLPRGEKVVFSIYNSLGQAIQQQEFFGVAGRNAIIWDGRDDYGQIVSAGVYLYKLQAGQFTATRKMNFVK